MGSFILGNRGIEADPYNSLFQHEYGHYLQSKAYGFGYISKYALPSLFDTFSPSTDHDFHPIEQDANARAFRYFNKTVPGFYKTEKQYDKGGRGWDFKKNPLNINNRRSDGYVDYNNDAQMKQVDGLRQHAGFFDYFSSFSTDIGGMAIVSLFNHVYYNGTKLHNMVPIVEKK